MYECFFNTMKSLFSSRRCLLCEQVKSVQYWQPGVGGGVIPPWQNHHHTEGWFAHFTNVYLGSISHNLRRLQHSHPHTNEPKDEATFSHQAIKADLNG